MVLGKGLESLIPPQQPFDKAQGEPHQPSSQPQGDLKNDPYKEESAGRFKADVPRTEPLAVPLGSVSDFMSDPAERGEEVRPLESDNPSSDRGVSAGDRAEKGIVFQIETDKIAPNPHQPRRDFDAQSMQELANSIREFGVIQPLVVTKIEKESERGWDVSYELVAGERRLMASKIVGLRTVPAIIRQVPQDHEKLELAITENVQRANLNPIEFARAIARLQEEFKLTQREIATRLGKSREAVANSVRLLSLPSEVQEAVAKGIVSESQARLLLSVDDVAQREKLFREIMTSNLTVREISSRVRQLKGRPAPGEAGDEQSPSATRAIDPELLALKEELETALGAPVELKRDGEGGKLTINFYSKEELEGILAKFKQSDSQSL